MIKSCTLKIVTNPDGSYKHIAISDFMKTILYESGILEVDFSLSIYYAKYNFQIVNIHRSFDDFMNENGHIYKWVVTRYGEFIIKECQAEVV